MSPDVVVGVDAGVVLGVGAGDRPGTGVDPALPGSSGFPEHAIPSANDNNDPDHDCSVNAADPRGKTGAGAISYDLQLGQIRSVKRG